MERIASIILTALILAGCESDQAREPKTEDLPGLNKNQAPAHVLFLSKSSTESFWETMHTGANQAASEFGLQLDWLSPATEGDPEGQARLLSSLTHAVPYVGVILAPQDATRLAPAVDSLAQKTVPVIIVDSEIATANITSFIASDNLRGGALAAQQIGLLLKGRGSVYMQRFWQDAPATLQRENSFAEELHRNFGSIELTVGKLFAGPTSREAYAHAKTDLQKLSFAPDAAFCPNEPSCRGLHRALRDLGMSHTRLVAFDVHPELVEGLKQGSISALLVQDPWNMGYQSVRRMADRLAGRPVPNQVSTSLMLVTRENLNHPAVQKAMGSRR